MKRFFKSFLFALNGIRFAWAGNNFRIQIVFAVLIIILGLTVGISATEWLIVFIFIGLVLAFEILNTALEHLVDFVSPEFHRVAGKIKDLAAGAVLILALTSVIAGFIIFAPYLLKFLP